MNWQLPALLLLTLSVASCQHKETTTITPPVDSPKIFLPYSVDYAGSIYNHNEDWNSYYTQLFDTMHSAIVTVRYPDTLHLNFHLAFWDVDRSNHDSLYYSEKDYPYLRNGLNTYLDSIRNSAIRFTIRGDSLLVHERQMANLWDQTVSFAGKRQ